MTTYTSNPAVVRTTINGIGYQIPYTQTVPNALLNLTGYPSGVAGVVHAWWNSQDQTTWQQKPDPEPPAPEPDWAGLRADLLSSSTVAAWFDTLPAINREDITAQIQGRNLPSLEDALSRVNYDSVKVELNQFLTNRNIGVQLP